MQYNHLKLEEKITGYRNRLRDLEVEHLSNSIFISECKSVGTAGDAERAELEMKNSWLDARYEQLLKELKVLEAEVEQEDK